MNMETMLYMYTADCNCMVYTSKNNTYKITDKKIYSYLKVLSFKSGGTLKGKQDFSKKLLKIRNKVPVFIHQCLLLFPSDNIQSENCIWINYYYITRVYTDANGCTHIIFDNEHNLKLNMSIRSLRVQLKRCKTICEFIEFL